MSQTRRDSERGVGRAQPSSRQPLLCCPRRAPPEAAALPRTQLRCSWPRQLAAASQARPRVARRPHPALCVPDLTTAGAPLPHPVSSPELGPTGGAGVAQHQARRRRGRVGGNNSEGGRPLSPRGPPAAPAAGCRCCCPRLCCCCPRPRPRERQGAGGGSAAPPGECVASSPGGSAYRGPPWTGRGRRHQGIRHGPSRLALRPKTCRRLGEGRQRQLPKMPRPKTPKTHGASAWPSSSEVRVRYATP